MLSIHHKLASAGVALVISMYGQAQEAINPEASVCEQMLQDIDHYRHLLHGKGGTSKQLEVWKQQYRIHVWQYGRSNCKAYSSKPADKAASSPEVDEQDEYQAP